MIIYYRNTDLELKKIDLANAIDVTINGIKITERGDELQLSVENQIQIIYLKLKSLFVQKNPNKIILLFELEIK